MKCLFCLAILASLTLGVCTACGDKETPNQQGITTNYLEGKTFYHYDGDVDMPRPRYYTKNTIRFSKNEVDILEEEYRAATPDLEAWFTRTTFKATYTYVNKVLRMKFLAAEEEDVLKQTKKDRLPEIEANLQNHPIFVYRRGERHSEGEYPRRGGQSFRGRDNLLP